MASRGGYNDKYWLKPDPALPVIRGFKVFTEDRAWEETVLAVVDSGADRSLLPLSLVAPILEFVETGYVNLRSFTGEISGATTVGLHFEIPGCKIRKNFNFFVARGREVILGRDVLNTVKTILDAPPLNGGDEPWLTIVAP